MADPDDFNDYFVDVSTGYFRVQHTAPDCHEWIMDWGDVGIEAVYPIPLDVIVSAIRVHNARHGVTEAAMDCMTDDHMEHIMQEWKKTCEHKLLLAGNGTYLICEKCAYTEQTHALDDTGFCFTCWEYCQE